MPKLYSRNKKVSESGWQKILLSNWLGFFRTSVSLGKLLSIRLKLYSTNLCLQNDWILRMYEISEKVYIYTSCNKCNLMSKQPDNAKQEAERTKAYAINAAIDVLCATLCIVLRNVLSADKTEAVRTVVSYVQTVPFFDISWPPRLQSVQWIYCHRFLCDLTYFRLRI